MIEIYKQITSELSKLNNELINNTICSHENSLDDMSPNEIYEVAQELFWMSQETQTNNDSFNEEDDYDQETTYVDEIIEEVEILLEKLAEYL
jgi:hypothetical protein